MCDTGVTWIKNQIPSKVYQIFFNHETWDMNPHYATLWLGALDNLQCFLTCQFSLPLSLSLSLQNCANCSQNLLYAVFSLFLSLAFSLELCHCSYTLLLKNYETQFLLEEPTITIIASAVCLLIFICYVLSKLISIFRLFFIWFFLLFFFTLVPGIKSSDFEDYSVLVCENSATSFQLASGFVSILLMWF